jgi:hypothetical protein
MPCANGWHGSNTDGLPSVSISTSAWPPLFSFKACYTEKLVRFSGEGNHPNLGRFMNARVIDISISGRFMNPRVIEPISLEGCAGRMCVDAGVDETYPRRRSIARRKKPDRMHRGDGVPDGTCWHCGLVGQHPTRDNCIDALRSRLAMLGH